MEQNKTGKPASRAGRYLKYAIGEIVLVVIGILIALQVNNWNIKRVNKDLEQQILIHLREEYESNLVELQEKIEIRSKVMSSTAWLINYIQERDAGISLDSLNSHLANTLLVPSYDPVISVTTELINSGKLQLIESMELRTKLTEWPTTTNDLVGEEEQFVTLMYEYYMMFLLKQYQLKPIVIKIQNDDALYNILDINRTDFSLGGKDKREDIDKLLNNGDFEDYLSLIMGFCNFLDNLTNAISQDNKNVLKLIESEIQN